MDERRGAYRVLVEKPERKTPLRWMDLQEVGCRGMDWIDLTQERAGGGHL
jgi:hypothetical protein